MSIPHSCVLTDRRTTSSETHGALHVILFVVCAWFAFAQGLRAEDALTVADDFRAANRLSKAAEQYEAIPAGSEEYGRASYLCALCYWALYLEAIRSTGPSAGNAPSLRKRAVDRLESCIRWAQQQGGSGSRHDTQRECWKGRATLLLAQINAHKSVGEYEKSLSLLDGFERKFYPALQEEANALNKEAARLKAREAELRKRKENRSDAASRDLAERIGAWKEIGMIPTELAACRITAYCALGRTEEAESERQASESKVVFPERRQALSKALVDGHIARMEVLAKEGATETELKQLRDFVANFAINCARNDVHISSGDLIWYGDRLADFGRKEEARDLFDSALARSSSPGTMRCESQRQVALTTEKAGGANEALGLWESVSGNAPSGTPLWFHAKYHEVSCLLRLGKRNEAASIMSLVLVAYPTLGKPDMPHVEWLFLKMLEEEFPKEDRDRLMAVREELMLPNRVKSAIERENTRRLQEQEDQ